MDKRTELILLTSAKDLFEQAKKLSIHYNGFLDAVESKQDELGVSPAEVKEWVDKQLLHYNEAWNKQAEAKRNGATPEELLEIALGEVLKEMGYFDEVLTDG